MFRKGDWRLAIIYVLLFMALMLFLAGFWLVSGCPGRDGCIARGMAGVIAAGSLAFLLLTLWYTSRRSSMLLELQSMARRIAGGEYKARVLPRSGGEEADLTLAINDMADRFRADMRKLAEQGQQLAIVFDNMADGVLITDGLGRVLRMNPAASRLLHADQEGAIGRSFAEVVRHHQLIDLWQTCRVEGSEAVAAVEINRNLFLQAFVTPFLEAGTQGYLVIIQDLTQVRFLQTVRRDFISNISHELRTPLAALRAIVETLQDGALEDPVYAGRFLQRAEVELDTMTQMVEELLELSRIESGEVPLRMAATFVSDLVSTPLARLQPLAEREDIMVVVDLPDDLPAVLADSERLQRVVANLLHNAIKFTAGGGTIQLAAYVERIPAPEVIIQVRDSGAGIAKEDQERVFERFFKSDRARTRHYGGTGLGLAIAKHLVEAHGGSIWVTSKEGQGSTFSFTVPTVDLTVN